MPNVADMFTSLYMKAADLQGGTISAVISHVTQEELAKNEMGWVIHFHPNPQLPRLPNGTQKAAVLKSQNAQAISHIYGVASEQWSGQSIELFVKQTT